MRRFHLAIICLIGLVLALPSANAAAPSLSIIERSVPNLPSINVAPASIAPHHDSPFTLSTLLHDSSLDIVTHGRAPSPPIALRWATDDAPIVRGEAQRTWTWGPAIFRSGTEQYVEAHSGQRTVWYLDKARMEITHPDGDIDSPWFVTTGLLVRELISGKLQTGDAAYESRSPADVPIAGDIDALPDQTITYADLYDLASLDNDRRAPNRVEFDPAVTETLHKGGIVSQDERFLAYNVHLRTYDEILGHNIAHVFTDALPADQLLYLAGRPLTEPYWVRVPINHVPTDVLIQAFERRVLTYTPSNPASWQVEWGNVGRQYAQWRYGSAEDGDLFDPSRALDDIPVAEPLGVLSTAAEQQAQAHRGLIGVSVLDLQTGQLYGFNGTRRFPMFSTAKVPIMLGVLYKAQREKREIAAWEDSLIRSMIHFSDNEASTALITHMGGADELNRYLRAIGLEDTVMDRYQWGYSTTTAQDMARLMAKLGNCTILNTRLCAYGLDVMRGVISEQRWGVSGGVPTSASVALKNGWFPEAEGWALHSIGYVKGSRTHYAIAVYSQRNSAMRDGIISIESISANVFAAISGDLQVTTHTGAR